MPLLTRPEHPIINTPKMHYLSQVFVLFSTIAVAAVIMKFPIEKMDDRHFVARMLARSQKKTRNSCSVGSSGALVVNDYDYSQYLGTISLGTPAQNFRVVFDTSTPDTWVQSVSCLSNCGRHTKFDSTRSCTFTMEDSSLTMRFAGGIMSGYLSMDTLQFGGLVLEEHKFGLITNATGLGAGFKLGNVDGVFGMAYRKIEGAPTTIENLVLQGQIDSAVFSFYLGDSVSGNGEVVLGGTDPEHYSGSLTWVPLLTDANWEIALSGLIIDGISYTSNARAIVNTGTSVLTAPIATVEKIAKILGAKEIIDGQYTLDCRYDDLPDMTFNINGNHYILSSSDYLITDGEVCLLGMIGMDIAEPTGPLWILGDIFMRKYYTVFDSANERIGFAVSRSGLDVDAHYFRNEPPKIGLVYAVTPARVLQASGAVSVGGTVTLAATPVYDQSTVALLNTIDTTYERLDQVEVHASNPLNSNNIDWVATADPGACVNVMSSGMAKSLKLQPGAQCDLSGANQQNQQSSSAGYMSVVQLNIGGLVLNSSVCIIPSWTNVNLLSLKTMKLLGVCHCPGVGLVNCHSNTVLHPFLP